MWLARQYDMDEIKDYLVTIDKKINGVRRAQNDADVAKVCGAGLDIESAMTVKPDANRRYFFLRKHLPKKVEEDEVEDR